MGGVTAAERRQRVLFLCTVNSCRSHIAEGLVNHLYGDVLESCSAGTRPDVVAVRLSSHFLSDSPVFVRGSYTSN